MERGRREKGRECEKERKEPITYSRGGRTGHEEESRDERNGVGSWKGKEKCKSVLKYKKLKEESRDKRDGVGRWKGKEKRNSDLKYKKLE